MLPIAAAAAQTFSNGMSGLINLGFQSSLQRQAFNQNVQMWEMMNQYNHPAQQMQRFREAGLNPNLIYGQGNPGNASSPPQYDPPKFHMSETQLLPLMQFALNEKLAFKSMEKTDAEIGYINANTERAREDTNVKRTKTLSGMLSNQRQDVENNIWYYLNSTTVHNYSNVPGSTNPYTIDYDNSYDIQMREQQMIKIMKDIDLINARIPNINANTTLTEFEAMIKKEDIDLGLTGSSGNVWTYVKVLYRYIQRMLQ